MVTPSLTGRRCRRDAMPKTWPPRCEQHYMEYESKGPDHVHRFYGAKLRPGLAQAMSEYMAATTSADRLDVSEEVFLLREQASHVVEKYSEVCERSPGSDGLEARALAGELMAGALRQVIDAVKVAGAVEEVKLEVAGHFAACMHGVLQCVVAAANRAFENDHRAAAFESFLREELRERAGRTGVDGTELTPDQDALEMDQGVPSVESTAADATA